MTAILIETMTPLAALEPADAIQLLTIRRASVFEDLQPDIQRLVALERQHHGYVFKQWSRKLAGIGEKLHSLGDSKARSTRHPNVISGRTHKSSGDLAAAVEATYSNSAGHRQRLTLELEEVGAAFMRRLQVPAQRIPDLEVMWQRFGCIRWEILDEDRDILWGQCQSDLEELLRPTNGGISFWRMHMEVPTEDIRMLKDMDELRSDIFEKQKTLMEIKKRVRRSSTVIPRLVTDPFEAGRASPPLHERHQKLSSMAALFGLDVAPAPSNGIGPSAPAKNVKPSKLSASEAITFDDEGLDRADQQ